MSVIAKSWHYDDDVDDNRPPIVLDYIVIERQWLAGVSKKKSTYKFDFPMKHIEDLFTGMRKAVNEYNLKKKKENN